MYPQVLELLASVAWRLSVRSVDGPDRRLPFAPTGAAGRRIY
jgi:hypothetical protein